jgi:hypothetical protein
MVSTGENLWSFCADRRGARDRPTTTHEHDAAVGVDAVEGPEQLSGGGFRPLDGVSPQLVGVPELEELEELEELDVVEVVGPQM